MYKNMDNPKSKIRLLLLSSIATIFAEIQGENKRKQEVKPKKTCEAKKMVKFDFFTKLPSSSFLIY